MERRGLHRASWSHADSERVVSGEPAGWELLLERLCVEGQKLSQKWGTASTLKPPAEGLWAFYRPFLRRMCLLS